MRAPTADTPPDAALAWIFAARDAQRANRLRLAIDAGCFRDPACAPLLVSHLGDPVAGVTLALEVLPALGGSAVSALREGLDLRAKYPASASHALRLRALARIDRALVRDALVPAIETADVYIAAAALGLLADEDLAHAAALSLERVGPPTPYLVDQVASGVLTRAGTTEARAALVRAARSNPHADGLCVIIAARGDAWARGTLEEIQGFMPGITRRHLEHLDARAASSAAPEAISPPGVNTDLRPRRARRGPRLRKHGARILAERYAVWNEGAGNSYDLAIAASGDGERTLALATARDTLSVFAYRAGRLRARRYRLPADSPVRLGETDGAETRLGAPADEHARSLAFSERAGVALLFDTPGAQDAGTYGPYGEAAHRTWRWELRTRRVAPVDWARVLGRASGGAGLRPHAVAFGEDHTLWVLLRTHRRAWILCLDARTMAPIAVRALERAVTPWSAVVLAPHPRLPRSALCIEHVEAGPPEVSWLSVHEGALVQSAVSAPGDASFGAWLGMRSDGEAVFAGTLEEQPALVCVTSHGEGRVVPVRRGRASFARGARFLLDERVAWIEPDRGVVGVVALRDPWTQRVSRAPRPGGAVGDLLARLCTTFLRPFDDENDVHVIPPVPRALRAESGVVVLSFSAEVAGLTALAWSVR